VASAPAPQFDHTDTGVSDIEKLVEDSPEVVNPADSPLPAEPEVAEAEKVPPSIEYIEVVHLTRTWVQYGIFGFAVLCIVIGAVEALFGR